MFGLEFSSKIECLALVHATQPETTGCSLDTYWMIPAYVYDVDRANFLGHFALRFPNLKEIGRVADELLQTFPRSSSSSGVLTSYDVVKLSALQGAIFESPVVCIIRHIVSNASGRGFFTGMAMLGLREIEL